jgi:hypothetical protein
MNKLDKQFEEMMKGIRIDSPSSDFTLKVMSRIQAEAAVQRRSVLQDYQPVISKRTWIIMIVAFVLFLVWITVSGQNTDSSSSSGIWTRIFSSVNSIKTSEVSSVWQKGVSMFSTIPSIAYLILTASLALWTLDLFMNRFRHHPSEIKI